MRKTKLTLLLLAALLVGVCIGFFGNNAIIQARIRHFSQIPGNMPEHITQKLTQRLDLDAGQRAQVFAIVQSFDGRLQEARDQSRATLDALMADMRAQIALHLTPEQQAEHAKLVAEIDARRKADRELRRAMRPPPPPSANSTSTPSN